MTDFWLLKTKVLVLTKWLQNTVSLPHTSSKNSPVGQKTFLVCTTFELWKLTTFECLTTKCFYGLIWMTFCICTLAIDTFCMHCCTNFLICYCNGNPFYIDNFYIAKLSPCPNPSSIGAEVVIFAFNPSTHLTNHPSAQKNFYYTIKQYL